MLPVETVVPAGKQNSEIPHSSLKSRPWWDSVIEVCCEVFLNKKQQGRTVNSNQITVKSAETELLLYPATHHQHPLNCSAVKCCNTKLSYFWNFPCVQKTSSQKATSQHYIAGWSSLPSPQPCATCLWHQIILGKIKMQHSQCEMGLLSTRKRPGCHLPILCSKMVSYCLKSLETLLLCDWFDTIARTHSFFS